MLGYLIINIKDSIEIFTLATLCQKCKEKGIARNKDKYIMGRFGTFKNKSLIFCCRTSADGPLDE